jgi:hypothetical protein
MAIGYARASPVTAYTAADTTATKIDAIRRSAEVSSGCTVLAAAGTSDVRRVHRARDLSPLLDPYTGTIGQNTLYFFFFFANS